MTDILVDRPRLRALLLGAGAWLALAVLVFVVLPGDGGGRGTPMAVAFEAVVQGMLNALTAAGLVVVYRSTRVVNFAQAALGVAGGEFAFQLLVLTGTPWWLAIFLGIAVAALAGYVFDLTVGRRFFRAPRLVLTVATIAVAALLSGLSRDAINALPFFPPASERSFAELSGTTDLSSHLPFASFEFRVGSLPVPFGFSHVLSLLLAVTALAGVAAWLRYAKSGIAVRAMAENTERASLLGISTMRLSSIVWTLAALLSGVGIIATGILSSPSTVAGGAPSVLIPALAAAVLARFTSIPSAVQAAVGISVFTAGFNWSFRSDGGLVDVLLFVIIGVGLLSQRRLISRSEDSGGVGWEAAAEQRQIPRELRDVAGIRWARRVMVGVLVVAVLVYPFVVGVGSVILGGVIAVNAILGLSMLILTGWAGQVSLGQYGFAAIGGVVSAALTSTVGMPFWVAVPIAVVVTAGVAALIGIPALRIRGLFLAVSTFAFASAVHAVLFSERYFGWLLPTSVRRPTLFLLDFADDRSMYFLCIASLLLSIILVVNLRRSRSGRVLIAVRENEANLQTFGVSALRAKLVAFAVSGGLAGFAGSLLVHLLRGTAQGSFAPQRSIDLFLIVVIGGVSSVPGVILGSVVFNVQTYFLAGNAIFASVQPFVAIVLLLVEPAGLIAVVNRFRDAILRIVAQRRKLVVPSLFADIDPEALRQRLVPLAPSPQAGGLSSLPSDARYVLATELYAGADEGRRFGRKRVERADQDGAAFGAAAERVTQNQAETPVGATP